MKYFRNPANGLVYSYLADGSEDAKIPETYIQLSEDEVEEHLNPPPVGVSPLEISKAQGLLALVHFDKYQAMMDLINAIPDPAEKLIAEINVFQRNTWERKNETLIGLATALEISSRQLDEMFVYGSMQ